ncbi:MAG: fumarylacetoacetate hydrolase family protein [Pseudomonadota bacterium]
MTSLNPQAAARELVRQHEARENFRALDAEFELKDIAAAYAVQDAYVAQLLGARHTSLAGYKIALTTPAMREMVGFHDSISGCLLKDQVFASGSTVRAAAYGHLIVEFEVAFEMAHDLPPSPLPWTGESILEHVACAYAALEVADDRHADYATLRRAILTLTADNAWNQGLVLGTRFAATDFAALAALQGIATIDGREVGRGTGRDVLGNPADALAWSANHLASRGTALTKGALVTTGSLVRSQFPVSGQQVEFVLSGVGEVRLSVE